MKAGQLGLFGKQTEIRGAGSPAVTGTVSASRKLEPRAGASRRDAGCGGTERRLLLSGARFVRHCSEVTQPDSLWSQMQIHRSAEPAGAQRLGRVCPASPPRQRNNNNNKTNKSVKLPTVFP